MPLLRECDHCGRVEPCTDPNDMICQKCKDLKESLRCQIEGEVWQKMEAKFGYSAAHAASVLTWVGHALDERPEEFRRMFGSVGVKMVLELRQAIQQAQEKETNEHS